MKKRMSIEDILKRILIIFPLVAFALLGNVWLGLIGSALGGAIGAVLGIILVKITERIKR